MKKLREEIEKIIIEHQNEGSKVTAIEICRMLEEEIDLAGNGWFDNDPVMLKELDLD